jgi:hypothetical protein
MKRGHSNTARRKTGDRAGGLLRGPSKPTWLVVSLFCVLVASPALAVLQVSMSPGAVSNGIHEGTASFTVSLTDSDLMAGYIELGVRAAFIDVCCTFPLTLSFDTAIVQGVQTELVSSPAGGSISWSNPSATPIADPAFELGCSDTGSENECVYRIRLDLNNAPSTGAIGDIPVTYAMAAPVPALPLVGRVVLGALLLAGGLRVRA